MIPLLRSLTFRTTIHADCHLGLTAARMRALAILNDFPNIATTVAQFHGQLLTLPDINELNYRQAGAEEWMASAIRVLQEADSASADDAAMLERYVLAALEHAGRILMHQRGIQSGTQKGYAQHQEETIAEREASRQKAEAAKAIKGAATRKAINDCFEETLRKKGNFRGIAEEVAKTVGVTPARVSQVRKGKH